MTTFTFDPQKVKEIAEALGVEEKVVISELKQRAYRKQYNQKKAGERKALRALFNENGEVKQKVESALKNFTYQFSRQ